MEIYEQGLDVSRYQGIIDWKRVFAAGKKFAIIRVVSSDTSGVYQDPNFERNYQGAKAAGIKVGAYYYSYALDRTYASAEIDATAKALEGKVLEYPVFADIEDGTIASMGRAKTTELATFALEGLRARGWYSALYTYTNFANAYLDMSQLSAYPFWVADYRQNVGYPGQYQMWQYSSSGIVAGVPTRVDLDNSYTDFVPALKSGGWNGYEAEGPQMIEASSFDIVVYGATNCEFFATPDVNEVLGSMPQGTYKALKASMGCYNKFAWATLLYASRVVYIALLPDRCYLTRCKDCSEEIKKINYARTDLTELLAYLK